MTSATVEFIDRDEIMSRLVNSVQDRNVCYALIGSRQIGKTRILREFARRVGEKAIVVRLDFSVNRYSPEDFSSALIQSLTDEYAKRVGGRKRALSHISSIFQMLKDIQRLRFSIVIEADEQGKPQISIKPELAEEKRVNKKELVELLARHDIPLIEDDILGELYFTDRRPIVAKAFDKTGLVMLCSSFSKDLCPGYRIGWVVPGRFESTIQWLKYTASVSAPTLPQYAIAEFLASGGYDHHLRRARKEYARNIARISQAVMKYFPAETRVTRPSSGFVLWVQMPDAVDSLELYSLAIKEGITLTPGYLFSPSNQFRNFIRINAADWSYKIDHALETLGDIIAELARK